MEQNYLWLHGTNSCSFNKQSANIAFVSEPPKSIVIIKSGGLGFETMSNTPSRGGRGTRGTRGDEQGKIGGLTAIWQSIFENPLNFLANY